MSFFLVEVNVVVDVAHFLPEMGGPDGCIHGHSWKVSAAFSSEELDNVGMAANPRDLKRLLAISVSPFAGEIMNDAFYNEKIEKSPTLENFAAIIFGKIQHALENQAKISILGVSVEQLGQDNYSASYHK